MHRATGKPCYSVVRSCHLSIEQRSNFGKRNAGPIGPNAIGYNCKTICSCKTYEPLMKARDWGQQAKMDVGHGSATISAQDFTCAYYHFCSSRGPRLVRLRSFVTMGAPMSSTKPLENPADAFLQPDDGVAISFWIISIAPWARPLAKVSFLGVKAACYGSGIQRIFGK